MAEKVQWEYQAETFGSLLTHMKDEELEAVLDQWGEDGWEVIGAYAIPGTYRFRVIAKRPVDQRKRRERTMPGYNNPVG